MAIATRVESIIEPCNDATLWTELNADVTTLADANNCVHGTGSVSFAKIDGAANATAAGIYRSYTNAIDWSNGSPRDEVVWYTYISDLTNVASALSGACEAPNRRML